MAEKTTFIKIDRNITKWRWYRNANTMRVFFHLLITANVSDCEFENITIKRGQRVISYQKLGDELGMTSKEVRTAINNLIRTNELAKRSTPQYTLLTVFNYDAYQSWAYQRANKGQTEGKPRANKGQQYNNTNNDNNEKNEKKSPASAEIEDTLKNRSF